MYKRQVVVVAVVVDLGVVVLAVVAVVVDLGVVVIDVANAFFVLVIAVIVLIVVVCCLLSAVVKGDKKLKRDHWRYSHVI